MELENKEFIAILTINNKEKLKIRCRLHHVGENEVMVTEMIYCQALSSTQLNQLDIIDVSLSPQVVNKAWYLQLAEPVWEHERQELIDMNKAPPSKALRETKEYQPLIEKYLLWRNAREERLA